MKPQDYKPHPGIAAVLSFLFTGLGQIYNGEIKKGFVIMFFSAVGMILTVLGAVFLGYWLWDKFTKFILLILGVILFLTGIIIICLLGVFSIIDAFKQARRISSAV
ncbi:MAG: hypothetical protein NC909_01935 [Candidatus Omnitrophica bacterium]|nr:hypothetical protein [Candidatus Omnitrophota bacterium]